MTPADLRQWRAWLGWSQELAAAELGVALTTYRYYEYGRTSRGKAIREIPRVTALACAALSARPAPDNPAPINPFSGPLSGHLRISATPTKHRKSSRCAPAGFLRGLWA